MTAQMVELLWKTSCSVTMWWCFSRFRMAISCSTAPYGSHGISACIRSYHKFTRDNR